MTNVTTDAQTGKPSAFDDHTTWGVVRFQGEVDKRLAAAKKKKLDPSLERDLEWGWLLPYLLAGDVLSWKRWDHWFKVAEAGGLIDEPIPKITFGSSMHSRGYSAVRDHIHRCLDLISNYGHDSWMGWSSWDNLNYFYQWLLFGLGHVGQKELPREPSPGASMRLYQYFDLNALIAYPYDYFGDIMAECKMGRGAGFYPTPHSIVTMMCLMTMGNPVVPVGDKDPRLNTCCDPCIGTGRMMLEASNYSYRLYGQDINGTCILACLINAALYAPWMYRPFPFWDGADVHGSQKVLIKPNGKLITASEALSESMTATVMESETEDPETSFFSYSDTLAAQAYLANTEHDTEEQWRYEPIKKRRRTQGEPDVVQGALW